MTQNLFMKVAPNEDGKVHDVGWRLLNNGSDSKNVTVLSKGWDIVTPSALQSHLCSYGMHEVKRSRTSVAFASGHIKCGIRVKAQRLECSLTSSMPWNTNLHILYQG